MLNAKTILGHGIETVYQAWDIDPRATIVIERDGREPLIEHCERAELPARLHQIAVLYGEGARVVHS